MPDITNLNNKIEAFGRIIEKNSITPYNVATLLLEITEILADKLNREDLLELQIFINQKLGELRSKDSEFDLAINNCESRLSTEASAREQADLEISSRIDTIDTINSNQSTEISYIRDKVDVSIPEKFNQVDDRISLAEANIEGVDETLTEAINNIQHPVKVIDTDKGDLVLADEQENPLLTVVDGHVRTANFDSANVKTADEVEQLINEAIEGVSHPIEVKDTDHGDIVITDEQETPILSVTEGHIRTANFDSAHITDNVERTVTEALPIDIQDTDEADLVFSDQQGHPILAVTTDGHIRTANFDSANIQAASPTVTPTVTVLDGADKLAGKKWCALGDSFTEGDFNSVTPPRFTDGPYAGQLMVYPFCIGQRTGMVVDNLAKCGMTLTAGGLSVMDVYQSIPADTDYVTIMIGINDAHQSAPLGSSDSTDTSTFCGAFNTLLWWLIQNRPYAHLGVIVSPSSRDPDWSLYAEATRTAARRYGIPVLDICDGDDVPYMLRQTKPGVLDSVIALRDSQYRVSPTNHHPNQQAHQHLSTIIEQFLRRL